jgi:hypothetical protein
VRARTSASCPRLRTPVSKPLALCFAAFPVGFLRLAHCDRLTDTARARPPSSRWPGRVLCDRTMEPRSSERESLHWKVWPCGAAEPWNQWGMQSSQWRWDDPHILRSAARILRCGGLWAGSYLKNLRSISHVGQGSYCITPHLGLTPYRLFAVPNVLGASCFFSIHI